MCPLCISSALGLVAGTATAGGVLGLLSFTRRLTETAASVAATEPEDDTNE